MRQDNEIELGRFAEFLLSRRMVDSKHAPHYVRWVRRFLAQGQVDRSMKLSERIEEYERELQKSGLPGWQSEQAGKTAEGFG